MKAILRNFSETGKYKVVFVLHWHEPDGNFKLPQPLFSLKKIMAQGEGIGKNLARKSHLRYSQISRRM
jgi:hypothetical protein